MNTATPIYQEMVRLGVEIASHESDLYVPVTDETTKIVETYPWKRQVTTFINNIDKKLWYDIPFAYLPWWEARAKKD